MVRPADTNAYTSGDLVANSTTAGSVVVPNVGAQSVEGGKGKILRVQIDKTGTGITNAAFRVHLHTTAPVATNGDNGVWLTTRAGYLGSVDVAVDKAFSNGASGTGAPTDPIPFDLPAGSKRIFAAIEARGAYTPASAEQFTVTLETESDAE